MGQMPHLNHRLFQKRKCRLSVMLICKDRTGAKPPTLSDCKDTMIF